MSSDQILRRITSLILLTCAVVTSLTIAALAKPRIERRLGLVPAEGRSYRPNDLIDLPASLFSGADRTVLIFARSGCGACRRAKPDLQALVTGLRARQVPVSVVTSTAFRKEELDFAAEIGVDADHVYLTDLTKLRLKVVPSVLVVDRRGRVLLARENTSELQQTGSILSAVIRPE